MDADLGRNDTWVAKDTKGRNFTASFGSLKVKTKKLSVSWSFVP